MKAPFESDTLRLVRHSYSLVSYPLLVPMLCRADFHLVTHICSSRLHINSTISSPFHLAGVYLLTSLFLDYEGLLYFPMLQNDIMSLAQPSAWLKAGGIPEARFTSMRTVFESKK